MEMVVKKLIEVVIVVGLVVVVDCLPMDVVVMVLGTVAHYRVF